MASIRQLAEARRRAQDAARDLFDNYPSSLDPIRRSVLIERLRDWDHAEFNFDEAEDHVTADDAREIEAALRECAAAGLMIQPKMSERKQRWWRRAASGVGRVLTFAWGRRSDGGD